MNSQSIVSTAAAPVAANKRHEAWPRCPEAADFFADQFGAFAAANPVVVLISTRLHDYAGVDMRALIDHWVFPGEPEVIASLRDCGLAPLDFDGDAAWEHPAARLPRVRVLPECYCPTLAIAVEDVDAFITAHGLSSAERTGDRDSQYECALCPLDHGALAVIARRGYRGFQPGQMTADHAEALREARTTFGARDRSGEEIEATNRTGLAFAKMAARLGAGRAVDEFFAAERRYYMSRNAAARWQYNRQQELGIGWANHDHHTYRSSRPAFQSLMRLWTTMGFVAREKFYAGADAGWGAQVLEHPASRVVIFSDVDMLPDELNVDYQASVLTPLTSLGTIGLWCALHGSSIGDAGMHHLEAEFDFAYINRLLTDSGHATMKPFTDLPMLKQAFTEPEIWPVDESRITTLLNDGILNVVQADRFRTIGAAGSHLEVLQRWEGYKGFNKAGISSIIRETDARKIS